MSIGTFIEMKKKGWVPKNFFLLSLVFGSPVIPNLKLVIHFFSERPFYQVCEKRLFAHAKKTILCVLPTPGVIFNWVHPGLLFPKEFLCAARMMSPTPRS